MELNRRMPTRWESFWFSFRAMCFRMRRRLRNWFRRDATRYARAEMNEEWSMLAQYRGALFSTPDPAEFTLQAGKVQNLRMAVRALDGVRIPAGGVWSFWAHLGRPSRRRGFAPGRELREGCVIPTIGGGLCQLSNAMYDMALAAGFEIIERHAHTQRVPNSMTIPGRDATVFWNYVDLRLRAPFAWQIEARIEQGELRLRLHGESRKAQAKSAPVSNAGVSLDTTPTKEHAPESCESCGMSRCFRHSEMESLRGLSRTAWLVDEWWPEFATWMEKQRCDTDWLFIPLNGSRWGTRSYRWKTEGWTAVREEPWFTLRRSWRSRQLAREGAARQRAQAVFAAELAERYSRRLPFDAMHIVVAQTLLPYLWRSGALAGRSFDVLMQRLPLTELHRTLDAAAAQHSNSATIADYRADRAIIAAETEALAAAARWITPHHEIARLAGAKAVLLDWCIPSSVAVPKARLASRPTLIFPASTLARKGCHEVRGAARALDAIVVLGGPVLEAPDFWNGIETITANAEWRLHDGIVVMPTWTESQPRRLLQALADGLQIITTRNSGLTSNEQVTLIAEGDTDGLIREVSLRVEDSGGIFPPRRNP